MILREDLLEPIPGDNPAGEELRYESVYDEIKVARTEEAELPQGDWERERKTADYGKVIKLAQMAIATESKDLQLAAWLSDALLREHGFQGFLEGLTLIDGLLDHFWEHVYPELEDGDAEFRAMPLEWLGNYLDPAVRSVPLNDRGHTLLDYAEARAIGYEADAADKDAKKKRAEAIEAGKVTLEDYDKAVEGTSKTWYKEVVGAVDECLAMIDVLDTKGDEKFGDVAPSYSALKTSIGEFRRLTARVLDEKLELEPDPVEASPDVATASGTDSAAAPETAVSVVPTSVSEAASRITEAARFLRHEDPRNPAPYALLRGFRWAEIRRGGDPPDPRLLEAPPTDLRTRLKGMLLDENWSALVDAAEEVMATPYGRGWLDLQRYVMTALTGLGEEYSAVRGIVREALARLLIDLPSLPDQALMDDSPTANRQTRDWLQAEGILDGDGAKGPSIPASVAGGATAASAIVARARGLVRKGEAGKAVELLLGEAERARHPRDAFLHRTEAAAVMLDSGMDAVARPILDDMMKQIETHSLDAWEAGDVVARPLVLLFRIKRAAGKKTDDLYERIIRLDPVQAVQLQQEERTEGEDGASTSSRGDDAAAKRAAKKAAAKKAAAEKAEDGGDES